jgi:hypothetical protein
MKQQRKNSSTGKNNKGHSPFLYNDLFKLNINLNIKTKLINNMQLVIVDNLFGNFNNLRKMILNCPPGNWKYKNGGFNFKDYYDCRLSFPSLQTQLLDTTKNIILNIFNKKTTHSDKVIEVNWFKQIKKKRSNFAFPHSDQSSKNQSYTCLIFLNSKEECSGGTAFFKNKILNKDNSYLDKETEQFYIENPDSIENGYDYWGNEKYWDIISHIEMKPNRMIIFPSHYLHAAYHPKNSFFNKPRLTLVFWLKETNEK